MKRPGPTVLLVLPLMALLAGQAAAVPAGPAGLSWWSAAVFAPGLLLCLIRPGWGLLGLACALAFHWGLSAHHRLLHPRFPPADIHHLAQQAKPVLVEGRLYREPELRGGRSRWYLAAERAWDGDGPRKVTGNVLVTVRHAYRHWRYGDVIRVPLRLRQPRSRDAGFDYRAFLARRAIYRIAYLDNDWEAARVRRTGGARAWIESVRRRVGRFVDRRFEADGGGLIKALLLGDRGGLTPEMRDRFAAVGMSHVLSISGLHVGMLSYAVFVLLRVLASRSTRLLLSLPLHQLAALGSLLPVFLYAAMAGARIPTVRAAVMIGLYQLAVLSGRQAGVFRVLAVAALIAALCWPGAVMEVSFQLSFLAVLAIVGALRFFRHMPFPRPPNSREPRWPQRLAPAVLAPLLVTFFAAVGTGPVVAHHFGYLSLAGFVANPLLVPLVGFVLVPVGLLMGFLSLFLPAAASWLVLLLKPSAALFLWAVEWLSTLPMAALSVPRPGWTAVAAIYLGLLTIAACAVRMLRAAPRKPVR